MSSNKKQNRKAWVVAVDMGYGHERAANPFSDIANEGIIIANNYQGIPEEDRRVWQSSRKFYEFVSRAKYLPLIGNIIFGVFDYFQRINPFYPRRDLSAKTMQLKYMYRLMRHSNWGKNLIEYLNKDPQIPFLATFFNVAFFAEYHGYKGDIYCIVTDTDISRTWAPLEPHNSKIKYLAPTNRAVERLKLYGVKPQNIFLTGFPLPKDNIGGRQMTNLKSDLWDRIHQLDPTHKFINKYHESLNHYLGPVKKITKRPLTLTFAVGGAGAQRELGANILKSLRKWIISGKIKINLIAGIRNEVYIYFKEAINKLGLQKHLGENIDIIFAINKNDYFDRFNQILRVTDILWTKPSELAFFTALGIPIVISDPIGSQEFYNQNWLTSLGGGINQDNPKYADQWLSDWLESGWLAEAAFQGFLDAPKFGTYKIEEIIFNKSLTKTNGHVELL
ncbi:MAG: hypothetical protein WC480_01530 [Patescibacteria group bacterium]